MKKISIDDLQSNEVYRAGRDAFRKAIMEHKNVRRIALGPNSTLHFEDTMTMRYQVQELMRAENITEPDEILQELEAYNPLIPDGRNLKATFMIEYPDENERRSALATLIGIENGISIVVDGCDPVYPIANEDLERSTAEKTSSVHFLRFEFPDQTVRAARTGANWTLRSEHPNYSHEVVLSDRVRESLLRDFD
jgi:hypothetical protein